jgi:FkbM family methyltransferase
VTRRTAGLTFVTRAQRFLARWDLVAEGSFRVAQFLLGVRFWNLGHDADQETNGEARLVAAWAPSSRVCVDVGANKGEWTDRVLESNPDARMYLFEPSPTAFDVLVEKFSAREGVRIFAQALGDRPGRRTFFAELSAGETSSLLPGVARPDAHETEVDLVRLEDAMAGQPIRDIDFLKIDCEGFDLKVLRGARELLEQRRIGVLQFEYNDYWRVAGARLADAYELLEGAGYRVFLLRGRGLLRLRDPADFYHYSNFVAVAPQCVQPLAALLPHPWARTLLRAGT